MAETLLANGVQVVLENCERDTAFGPLYDQIRHHVDRHLVGPAPYLLDYTGGTAAMVTCVVRKHIVDHGGRPDLRTYVDDIRGALVTDAGTEHEIADVLGMEQIALLHGYRLTGSVHAGTPPAVPERMIRNAWPDGGALPLGVRRDRLTALVEALGDVGSWRGFGGERAPEWTVPEGSAGVRGAATELCYLAALGGAAEIDELGCRVKAVDLDAGSSGPAVEFDLVARHRHRLLVVEAKSSLRHTLDVTGSRLVMARAVFGSATSALLAAVAQDRDLRDERHLQLGSQLHRWNSVLPSMERFRWYRPDGGDIVPVSGAKSEGCCVRGVVRRTQFRPRLGRDRRPGVDPALPSVVKRDHPPEVARLMTPAGGSPLAVAATVTAVAAAQVSVIATAEAWKGYQLLHGALVATGQPVGPLGAPEQAADLAASTVHGLCAGRARTRATLGVTPGTKSATAGLVNAAVERPDELDLLHVDLDGGHAHSWRHGSWPHRPAVAWAAVLNPSYEPEADPGWWRRLGERRADDRHRLQVGVLQRVAEWVAASRYALWFSVDTSVSWWVPLLITGRHRAVGVVAPYSPEALGNRGPSRQVAMAAAQHLHTLLGDAGRMLFLLHPAERAAAAQWRRPYRGLPEPMISFWDDAGPGFDGDLVAAALS